MPRQTVHLHSSALRSASYDDDTQELDITFASGDVFTYSDVPPDVFLELTQAPSAGRYWHAKIKDQYA